MARPRLCSECGGSLAGKKSNAKTCSESCRRKRSRRLRGEAKERDYVERLPEPVQAIRDAVAGRRDDVVDRVVQEELRPVVREAITEDTLRAIQDLIALTPEVVTAISEDLRSDDATIRQKAYSLIARYTIGHPAIVRPPEDDGDKQLVVNFNIPRPGPVPQNEEPVIEAEQPAVELEDADSRQCDMCGDDKPLTEFVAGSYRCVECYGKQQDRAAHLFDDG